MDFLDSLDIDNNSDKLEKIQSWYIYEQYKSLQKHQSNAARKLKDKTYQNILLYKELNERRTRRSIVEQSNLYEIESKISRSLRGHSSTSINTDVFESIENLELNDEINNEDNETGDNSKHYENAEVSFETECDYASQTDTVSSKTNIGFLSPVCKKENMVSESHLEIKKDLSTESVNSVIQTVQANENLADHIKEELEAVKRNILSNLTLHFQTVKENIKCINKYKKTEEEYVSSDLESQSTIEKYKSAEHNKDNTLSEKANNVYFAWCILMAFAYQTMQLNHGNCYNDCCSQLLVAVLVADVMRRGVNRLCCTLQPYVSPIKYLSDEDAEVIPAYAANVMCRCSEKSLILTKILKSSTTSTCQLLHKCDQSVQTKNSHNQRPSFIKCSSEKQLRPKSKEQCCKKARGTSEPGHITITKYSSTKSSTDAVSSASSLWPEDLETVPCSCQCDCHSNVDNPMKKLVRYLDNVFEEAKYNI